MNRLIRISCIFFVGLCLVPIFFPAEGRAEVHMVATPYAEYAYLTDMDGAAPVLDRINEMVGGWLGDYKDFELFNHLFLIGTEFRIGFPDRWRGLEFSFSISGSAGSVGMIGGEYDEYDTLNDLPDIPTLPDLPVLPSLLTIDGTVHTRIDQFLDYAIPLQLGVRYELERIGGKPFAFFGSVCGGPIFIKGGMDIDVAMNGTASFLALSETFDGKINGKAYLKDTGWIASMMAGIRYDWNERTSTSFAIGYGVGEVQDNAEIRGRFSGGSPNLGDVNIDMNFSEPIDLDLNSFRLRCEILTWRW